MCGKPCWALKRGHCRRMLLFSIQMGHQRFMEINQLVFLQAERLDFIHSPQSWQGLLAHTLPSPLRFELCVHHEHPEHSDIIKIPPALPPNINIRTSPSHNNATYQLQAHHRCRLPTPRTSPHRNHQICNRQTPHSCLGRYAPYRIGQGWLLDHICAHCLSTPYHSDCTALPDSNVSDVVPALNVTIFHAVPDWIITDRVNRDDTAMTTTPTLRCEMGRWVVLRPAMAEAR